MGQCTPGRKRKNPRHLICLESGQFWEYAAKSLGPISLHSHDISTAMFNSHHRRLRAPFGFVRWWETWHRRLGMSGSLPGARLESRWASGNLGILSTLESQPSPDLGSVTRRSLGIDDYKSWCGRVYSKKQMFRGSSIEAEMKVMRNRGAFFPTRVVCMPFQPPTSTAGFRGDRCKFSDISSGILGEIADNILFSLSRYVLLQV